MALSHDILGWSAVCDCSISLIILTFILTSLSPTGLTLPHLGYYHLSLVGILLAFRAFNWHYGFILEDTFQITRSLDDEQILDNYLIDLREATVISRHK